jgi:hypothetical protein
MKGMAEAAITALTTTLRAASLAGLLMLPQISLAQYGQNGVGQEDPSALAMVGDAVLVRPLGLVFTAVGAVVFVVTLPFSALGGNVGQAGDTLVAGPFRTTFDRCLGCTRYTDRSHHDVVEPAPVVEQAEPPLNP